MWRCITGKMLGNDGDGTTISFLREGQGDVKANDTSATQDLFRCVAA